MLDCDNTFIRNPTALFEDHDFTKGASLPAFSGLGTHSSANVLFNTGF